MIKLAIELEDASGNPIPKDSVIDWNTTFNGDPKKVVVSCQILHFRSLKDKKEGKEPLLFGQYKGLLSTPNGKQAGFSPYEQFEVKSLSEIDSKDKICAILIPKLALRFKTKESNITELK